MKNLFEFKQNFDKRIENYLEKKQKEIFKISSDGAKLLAIIREFIRRGGKRLRPAIFYSAYQSYNSSHLEIILEASFVFELFHTFALIHDDIIDQADQRRGLPTVHKKYGINTAILVGDLALILADEIFFNAIEKLNLKDKNEIYQSYHQFKKEVIIGEYLDAMRLGEIEVIADLKTARYSFVRPAEIGLRLARVGEKEILYWKKILSQIGILFQLKDDFEGTFADEKKLGKTVISDFSEGKKTLIVEFFLKKATKEEKEKFFHYFGKGKNKKIFYWYRDRLINYGIDEEIRKIIIEKAMIEENQLKKYPAGFLRNILEEVINLIKKF